MRKCLRENNYICKHCVNKFDNENDLREHISRTHREKLYACDPCDQAFKRKDMLKNHMRNMHKEINTREINTAYLSV